MIKIDPQVQPEPEPEGYEFGYYTFDPLPALEVHDIKMSSEDQPKMILLRTTYVICL